MIVRMLELRRIRLELEGLAAKEAAAHITKRGPLLTFQYSHAPPTYPGRHRHLDIMEALARGDGTAVRQAVCDDTIEGGARLLRVLTELDTGLRDEAELGRGETDAEALGRLLR